MFIQYKILDVVGFTLRLLVEECRELLGNISPFSIRISITLGDFLGFFWLFRRIPILKKSNFLLKLNLLSNTIYIRKEIFLIQEIIAIYREVGLMY